MQVDKRIWMIIAALVILLILYFTFNDQYIHSFYSKPREIAIITKAKYGYNWQLINEGAQAAANEFGANIQILATDYDKDVISQINLVETAIENEVDAIIISPIDFLQMEEVLNKTVENDISIIVIVCEADIESTFNYVGSNHYMSGQRMGAALIKQMGIKGNLCIITDNSNDIVLREKGLEDYLTKHSNIKIVSKKFCSSQEYTAAALTSLLIGQYNELHAIVGLNAPITLGISKAIEKSKTDISIIGFGNTKENINYLDIGIIDQLVVENDFSIGYMAVKNIIHELQGKSIASVQYIDTLLITSDNMNHSNIQKIIYPIE